MAEPSVQLNVSTAVWKSPLASAKLTAMPSRTIGRSRSDPPIPPDGADEPHFIWHWRRYRHLNEKGGDWTQAGVAERAGMTANNLSQLENYKQGYSEDGLDRLAKTLRCTKGQLLSVNPLAEDEIWPIWERADKAEREQIVRHAKVIVSRS